MGTTLDNGTYLPDEGERNCYEGLAGNWVALDNHLGSINIHVTINDKQAWNGHVADTTIHVTSADKQTWNSHVADSVKHVTAEDKAKWDAVTSKANDSDVVHKSGNETVGGAKTFTNDVTVYNSDSTSNTPYLIFKSSKYSRGSTTELDTQYIRFLDKNSKNCGQLSCYGKSSGNTLVSLFASNTDSNNQTINSYVTLLKASSGYSSFYANSDNATSLGEANKRWSDVLTYKVNNLEPSSLSLPDLSNGIDISGYINVGDVDNTYTPPANGWIWIRLIGNDASIIQGDFGINSSYVTNNVNNQKWVETNLFVTKNIQATIRCRGITGLVSAKFYPCRGNV